MSNVEQIVCDFCGKSNNKLIIQGEHNVHICSDCVKDFYLKNINVISNKFNEKKKKVVPSFIKQYLDEYIIGQDNAKKVLSVAVYNHYKSLVIKKRDPTVELDKSNIILVGPSGSGKTAILKALAKFLKVPFAMADATTLTEKGYVGNDVESVLTTLVQNANGDIKKAERGIVYIDEIDKLSKRGKSSLEGVSCGREGVQQALLKMIEGSIVELPNKRIRNPLDITDTATNTKIDTSNILFIVGGAFEGIDKIISKRLDEGIHKIGFESYIDKNFGKSYNDFIDKVTTEDLKSFGIIPELLGRLPIVTSFKELTKEELIKVLTEPKNALIKQYSLLLKEDGVNISFTDKALELVAEKAIKRKTGARSLRSILENTLQDLMYKAPELEDVSNILIDCVDNEFIITNLDKEQEGDLYYGKY